MNKKKFFNTRDLVLASMFIALSVLFKLAFSIPVSEGLILSFKQTPIILAGIVLGPIWGLVVGALADVIGFFAKPMGFSYLPTFTVVSALIGLIPGLMYRYVFKKKLLLAVVVSVVIDMLLVNGLLATYFLALVYSMRSFGGWLSARMPVEVIMSVVQSVICILIVKAAKPVLFKDSLDDKPAKPKIEPMVEAVQKE